MPPRKLRGSNIVNNCDKGIEAKKEKNRVIFLLILYLKVLKVLNLKKSV